MIKLAIFFLLTVAFIACQQVEKKTDSLPKSTPEKENVSADAILNFLDAVEKSNHEFHSLMILRHGKIVAEGWWDPYQPELVHTMYSTSKSFVSTSIGFAVNEKLITVNDKVISFFPEDLPEIISPELADLEVRHLLTMSVGQDPEPTFSSIISNKNWVKSFLQVPIVHQPGTKFLYNSSATYMLSAIIHKVTGENVVDYLKPRLFDPLAISGMDWEVDPMGINTGGWGLRVKTEDMAKLGQLYLQKGKWQNQQILPEKWVDEATTMKIDQQPDLSVEEKSGSDWLQGYGYKFWRSRHNSYRGDGAYGQYILVLPEQDAVIAITSETGDMQGELNLVWEHLLPAFKNEKINISETEQNQLTKKLNSLKLKPPVANVSSACIEKFDGQSFLFEANDEQLKSISFKNEFGIIKTNLIFEDEKNVELSFGANQWNPGETNKPVNYLAAQETNQILKLAPFKIMGAFSCINDSTIDFSLKYIESPHTDFYKCTVSENKLQLEISHSRAQRNDKSIINGIRKK